MFSQYSRFCPVKQLVRFVIEHYRDELLISLQGNIDDHQVAEDREAVASDLLSILHRYACLIVPRSRYTVSHGCAAFLFSLSLPTALVWFVVLDCIHMAAC